MGGRCASGGKGGCIRGQLMKEAAVWRKYGDKFTSESAPHIDGEETEDGSVSVYKAIRA